jgi:hypothetical protein
MLSLRSKSGHDEIVSASETQTIAMAHASSLDAHKVHIYPPLSCNDYLCRYGGKVLSKPNQTKLTMTHESVENTYGRVYTGFRPYRYDYDNIQDEEE